MFKNIQPLHDRILVKRSQEQEEKTAGGIIIPDTTKEKAQKIYLTRDQQEYIHLSLHVLLRTLSERYL